MSREKIVVRSITVLAVSIALLSFTKCIIRPHYGGERYMPLWVCSMTALELVILWLSERGISCLVCILANAGATMVPYGIFRAREAADEFTSSVCFFPTDLSSLEAETRTYIPGTLLFSVYLIIGLGVAITVLYLFLFYFREKDRN